MKATVFVGNRRQQNYEEAKAVGQLPSHGGKAIKIPRIDVHLVFKFLLS